MFKSIINKAFFCYAARAVVPANDVTQPAINFSNDSDFILKEIRTKPQATGAILLTIFLASGEQFSNIALSSEMIAAGLNSDNSIKFIDQIRIPANSQFNVKMENTTGGDLTHEIQLWGYKVEKE